MGEETFQERKARGGFYTPDTVVDTVLEWAGPTAGEAVLEPSCGDGAFLAGIRKTCPEAVGIAVEPDPVEAVKAASRKPDGMGVAVTTFQGFCAASKDRFDLVVGNPPYIRSQELPDGLKATASALCRDRFGFRLPPMSNAWAFFVAASAGMLVDGGRMGLVVPKEILGNGYGEKVRAFLCGRFGEVGIVLFDTPVFPGVQQDVVLLLCRNAGGKCRFPELSRLPGPASGMAEADRLGEVAPSSPDWKLHWLSPADRDFAMSVLAGFPRLGDLARVSVAVTTGANDFFVLSRDEAEREGVSRFFRPGMSKGESCPGLLLDAASWEKAAMAGAKCLMADFPDQADDPSLAAYLRKGESMGIPARYKCRNRNPWYRLPKARPGDGILTRRVGDGARIILNGIGALTTDSLHKVVFLSGADPLAVSCGMMTSVASLSCELAGRHHSGGALELLPREAEAVRIPQGGGDSFAEVHAALEKGAPWAKACALADTLVLEKGCGMSATDAARIARIARMVREKRIKRQKRVC